MGMGEGYASTATASGAAVPTQAVLVEEVTRAVREAEVSLEQRLENRWELRLTQLRERFAVSGHCNEALARVTVERNLTRTGGS